MPRSFRGYEVKEKIGAGGMSTLYKGVQTALGRTVAIKLLHPGLADDASFIARFEREARAASALGHPNIVSVIDFGSEDDVYYIVMEYVPGTDLRVVLDKTPKLPPEIVLALLEEVAYGLDAAHERGIIHRDIKPGNVLLSTAGQVKVADFGLARQASDIERISALTVPGSVLGTPAYMSPEQAAGKDIDHRTDIYALGVMAYELFTGEKPFQGGTYSEIRDQIINHDPPRISKRAAVTEEIEALVGRMMAKDPDKRFLQARNLVRAIEDCMETLDPSGGLIKHRRRYLARFAQDPAGFSDELRRSSVSAHLDRGLYFQQMGLSKIDDAVREFRYVLFLDPENSKARDALDELHKKADESGVRFPSDPGPPRSRSEQSAGETTRARVRLESGERTRVLPDEAAPAAADERTRVDSGAKPRASAGRAGGPKPEGASAIGRLVRPAAIGAGVLALAFVAWRLFAGGGGAAPSPAGALLVESDPSGAAVSVRGPGDAAFRETGLVTNCTVERLAAGEWDVRVALAGHEPEVRRVGVRDRPERVAVKLSAVPGSSGTPPPPPPVPPAPAQAGRIAFSSTPDGAKISVRGPGESGFRDLPGVTPFTSDTLAAGSWEVRADREGYVRQTSRVDVGPGTTAAVALALVVDEPTGDGFVKVTAVPFADIYVDGKLVQAQGKKVVAAVPATPGKRHVVELRHPSFGTHKFDRVAVTSGDTTDLGRYDFKVGALRVFCKPSVPADVYIDGKKQDRQTPFFSDRVGAVKHKVGLMKEGFVVKEAIVIDPTGAEKKLRPSGARNEVEITVPPDGEVKLQFVVEKKG